MAFSEDVVFDAWNRAGGRCECTRATHRHFGRCAKELVWFYRGKEVPGGWEAHHKSSVDAGGDDNLRNCEILCHACHKATRTHGN